MLRAEGLEADAAASHGVIAAWKRAARSLRFQLLLGTVLAVALPLLFTLLLFPSLSLYAPIMRVSVLTSTGAFLLGLYALRKLTSFPGLNEIMHVLPSFLISYASAATIVLFLRLDYNRVFLFSSMGLVVIGFFFVFAVRAYNQHFYLCPFGSTQRAAAFGAGEWFVMTEPHFPTDRGASVVVDLHADLPDEWERMLASAALSGVPVYDLKYLEESLTGKTDIERLSENNLGSLVPNLAFRKFKSAIDWLVALAALPLLLPVFAIVAMLIRLDSPGPVFFRQLRVGQGGKPFKVFKFRSMEHRDATSVADRRRHAITQNDDPRVTAIGRIIRRYRVDELPQALNILRGEMSWIGPRPEAVELSNWYESELPFYSYRNIVQPGLTGWAQVNQGHVAELTDAHNKLRYDFYYIKNFSLWLDLLIIFRTIRTVLNGFGAK